MSALQRSRCVTSVTLLWNGCVTWPSVPHPHSWPILGLCRLPNVRALPEWPWLGLWYSRSQCVFSRGPSQVNADRLSLPCCSRPVHLLSAPLPCTLPVPSVCVQVHQCLFILVHIAVYVCCCFYLRLYSDAHAWLTTGIAMTYAKSDLGVTQFNVLSLVPSWASHHHHFFPASPLMISLSWNPSAWVFLVDNTLICPLSQYVFLHFYRKL